MAGNFAPKGDFNVAFEQPQQPVAPNQGLQTAISGLSNLFASASRNTAASKKDAPDPLVGQFVKEMQKNEQLRAQGKEQTAIMNERKLVANFVSAGGKVDASLKSTVEAMTGRSFDYMGQTEDQRQLQALRSTEEYRTSYLAASATLGPDATSEQVEAQTLSSLSSQAVAADTIAQIRAGQKVSWESQGQGAYLTLIENFQSSSIGALMQIQANGGKLTPNEVMGAQQQWAALKQAALTRPPGITDDQWRTVQGKLEGMDNLFQVMNKASSSEQAMENMQSIFVNSLGDGAKMTFEEVVVTMAAMKSPDVILDNLAINTADVLQGLSQRSTELKKTQAETRLADTLIDTQPTQPGGGSTVVTANTIIEQNPDEFAQYKDISPEQMVKDLKGNNMLIGAIDVQNINGDKGAAQDFADAMQGVGVVLMNAQQFVSSDMIRQLTGGGLKEKLAALEAQDPQGALEARVLMRSGLNSQLRMMQANEQSIMQSLGMTYDQETGRYYITEQKAQIAARAHHYKGEMTDKGFWIDPTQTPRPTGYGELLERRKALNLTQGALTELAVPTSKDNVVVEGNREVELTEQGLSTLTQFDPIKEAATMLGWSEQDQFFKLSDYMATGGQGIDPRDTAWCAAFVNSVLNKTGYDGTGKLNARSFLEWGTNVDDAPRHGDVVVISRGNEPWMGHVGFFHGFDDNGNIQILGGNQGDAVSIKTYNKDRLLGFRRGERQEYAALPGVTGQIADGVASISASMAGRVANDVFSDSDPNGPQGGQKPEAGLSTPLGDTPTQEGSPSLSGAPTGGFADSTSPTQPTTESDMTGDIKDGIQIAKMAADEGKRERDDAVTDFDMERAKATSKKMTSAMMVEKTLTPKQKRQIKAAGFDIGEVEFFETAEEAETALAAGEVQPGTLYVDKLGNVFLLE